MWILQPISVCVVLIISTILPTEIYLDITLIIEAIFLIGHKIDSIWIWHICIIL